MKIISATEKFIFDTPAWRFVTIVLAIMIMKTGIWAIPNLSALQVLANDPFTNPFQIPEQQYLFWNWLGSFIAYLIHATSPRRFFALHLLFTIGFTALFVKTAFSRFDDRTARIALLIFVALPVSATAYYWVSYDSLTLMLMMAAIAMPRAIVPVCLVGIGLGMQHFEQSFVGACAVFCAMVLAHFLGGNKPYSWRWLISLITGVVLGKLVLLALVHHLHIQIEGGRVYWLEQYLPMTLNQFSYHPFVTVFSAFGVAWMVVFKQFDEGSRAAPMLIVLAGLMFLLPISGDQTRVFAVSSFLMLAAYWMFNPAFLQSFDNKTVSVLFLAWAVVPWAWVWGAVPRASALPMNIAVLLHALFGWPAIPADTLTWPFY